MKQTTKHGLLFLPFLAFVAVSAFFGWAALQVLSLTGFQASLLASVPLVFFSGLYAMAIDLFMRYDRELINQVLGGPDYLPGQDGVEVSIADDVIDSPEGMSGNVRMVGSTVAVGQNARSRIVLREHGERIT